MRGMHLTPFRTGALVGLFFALVGSLLVVGEKADRIPGLKLFGSQVFAAANWLCPWNILWIAGTIQNWVLMIAIAVLGNAIVYGTIGWMVGLVARWFRSSP